MGTSAADAEKKLEIPIKAAGPNMPRSCIVHPLVLLSATDHYMRVAKDTNKRVIGVLLGAKEIAGERDTWKTTTASAGEGAYSQAGMVNITNSFAIPFEEDDKDPKIWFADHNYLENMFGMFKKVNAREKIVGWYSTGPKIRSSDLEINEVFKKFTKNPVLVIIDVQPKDELVIPTDAYMAVEEVKDVSPPPPWRESVLLSVRAACCACVLHNLAFCRGALFARVHVLRASGRQDGTPTRRSFQHLPSEIGAEEAEEIGVEHLLRDIKDTTVSTLAERVSAKLASLKGLKARLEDIHTYLKAVADGKLPVNHEITYLMQEIFNLLPNLNVEELVRSFSIKTNDMMLVRSLYLRSEGENARLKESCIALDIRIT
jgi:26S proteasome regulatory subunit N8